MEQIKPKKQIGQYFTISDNLQKFVFDKVKHKSSPLLEPSFGAGHLLQKFKEYDVNYPMTCYELDTTIKPVVKFNEKNVEAYARKPEKIANLVYGNRMGNGPEATGEGFKYRGRGYIQLTGKVNYQSFDKVVDEDVTANPDLVATKYPLLSAAWFWNSRTLNALADKGATDADVTAITKKVNGGTHGLEDRIAKFKKFYGVLTKN